MGLVLIAAVAGIKTVEIVVDKPQSAVPLPAAGRTCAALHVFRFDNIPGAWFYYTTPGACTLSWSFAALILVAVLMLVTDPNR